MAPTPPSAAIRASSSVDDLGEIAAAQGAEGGGDRVVRGDARRPRPVGERAGPGEGLAGVVVKAAGRRLPGQQLDGHGRVRGVAEMLGELGRLAGVGERARVVAQPAPPRRGDGEDRDQDAHGAASSYVVDPEPHPGP